MEKKVGLLKTSWYVGITCVLVLGAFCMPASQAIGANTVIDDFSVGQAKVERTTIGLSSVVSSTGTPAIIGGNRIMELYQTANNGTNTSSMKVEGSRYSQSNEAGATGYGVLEWNGTGTIGNYNLNLNMSGISNVHIKYISSDNETDVNIVFYTDGSNYATATLSNFEGTINDHYFNYPGDFSITGTMNWADVDRIRLYYNPKYAIDVELEQIDFNTQLPDIKCVTKKCTLNEDYTTGLVETMNLSSGQAFPFYLYCVFTVENTADGNDTLYIEDNLPLNMQLTSATPIVMQPSGFSLSNASGVGPNAIIHWTSSTELTDTEPLIFRHRIQVTSFDGLRTNTFQARATNGSFTKSCPFYLYHTVERVPSLNEWGMILLSLLLAASAIWVLRRKKTS